MYPTEQLRSLSVAERLDLLERVWESLEGEEITPLLTLEQEAELDRRIAEHEAHPEEAIPWEVAIRQLRDRLPK